MSKILAKSTTIAIISVLALFGTGFSDIHADSYKKKHSYHNKYEKRQHSNHKYKTGKHKYVIHRGPEVRSKPRYVHKHKNVRIIRHYDNYHGYGHYDSDDDAYKWLAFTAITVKILDNINEQQQREHEAAQVVATNAEVGETIIWNKSGASGAVTVVRDGTSTSGRYCREFQHEVTIGGKTQSAYGIACQQPDGSWEIISTGS